MWENIKASIMVDFKEGIHAWGNKTDLLTHWVQLPMYAVGHRYLLHV
jgi:hypothetical protein